MLHTMPILPLRRYNTHDMRPENQATWEAIRQWYRDNGYPVAAFYMGTIIREWEQSRWDPKMLLDQLRGASRTGRRLQGGRQKQMVNPRRFRGQPGGHA